MTATARLLSFAVAAAGILTILTAGSEPPLSTIEMKTVKYDALKEAVRAQRGKVVVVDVWSSTCNSCKLRFPDFLKMQERYAKDGLVCMSVSVDRARDDERKNALDFLRDHHATIANYWIDEKLAFWQDKFDTSGPPVVYVFDRQGKRAAKFDNNDPDKPFEHHDVESLVQQLLKTP